MTLGDRIKKFRKEREWTQDELAEKAGIHGRHLSKIENDHVMPTRKLRKRIAELFEISVEELTGDDKKSGLNLLDPELSSHFRELARLELDEEDKITIKRVLRAMITEKKMKGLLAPQK